MERGKIMSKQEFYDKLNPYFKADQIDKLAKYAENLDNTVKYGAIGEMNGYSFLCIRMQEESAKGILWLTTFIEDIIGEIRYKEDFPALEQMMEDMEVEW